MATRQANERRGGRWPGVPLGRWAGVEVTADWSLLLVVLLITFNLGAGLFPREHPGWAPVSWWTLAVIAAALFVLSILLHELAHAVVGRSRGVVFDGITLFMFGGVARMRGEPPSARAELAMAAVGPLVSLVIGAVSTAVGAWLARPETIEGRPVVDIVRSVRPLVSLLLWLGPINLLLGLFNLLPGFPLDGGRVLRALLWNVTGDLGKATRWASEVGRVIALLIVVVGAWMLFGGRVPLLGGGGFQGLWLIFIGWFLHNAAAQGYAQVVIRQALRGVPVARVMRRDIPGISPVQPVSDLVERLLRERRDRCVPVIDQGRLLGVACMADLSKVPREDWPSQPVRRIMTPLSDLAVVDPSDDLDAALAKLAANDVDQLPVVHEDRVEGIVGRADLLRWIEVYTQT